ncbi:MAG: hypothetical protein HRT99_00850 [Mycoplasmatales bacterium]|nr:hypothetical protein [Mycoplasmatales bacterium]
MAKKPNKKKEEELSFKLKNPKKYSLIIASIWIVVMFIMSIVGFLMNKRTYLWNINAASMLILTISLLWVMLKFGILEKSLYKFANYKSKSLSEKHDIKVEKISIEEYRKRRKEKSWLGIFTLFSFSLLVFIVTITIYYAV